jgi:uncharacterized membrane protein YcaP (DUF421 family)
MELFRIFLTAVGSFIVLFILVKIMGKREVSQMSMFDYINGITIGSIAAEMATSLEDDFLKPLIAMLVYAALTFLIAYITCKSMKAREILEGKSLILLDDGKLYKENLRKAKIDLNEFMMQCRSSGYFDVSNIQTAILENNGKISFLPVTEQRPATPYDLNLKPEQEKLLANVIVDGHIIKDNLRVTGNDEKWLEKQLHAQDVSDVSKVFLATCDQNNKLNIYVKLKDAPTTDFFD